MRVSNFSSISRIMRGPWTERHAQTKTCLSTLRLDGPKYWETIPWLSKLIQKRRTQVNFKYKLVPLVKFFMF
jgi:hypothetical protein